jgi:hypothetical protein
LQNVKLKNVGTIYTYKNRPEIRIAINDRSGLESLIRVIDNFPLVTEHQLTRYLLLKEYLMKEIKEFKTLEDYNKFNEELLLSIKATLDNNSVMDFNESSLQY